MFTKKYILFCPLLVISIINLIVFDSIEAARILAVFPTPSISHQVVFRPLTQELARRGHEVVVITADPAFPKGQAPPNLTEIDVHEISYTKWKTFFGTAVGKIEHLLTQFEVINRMMSEIFEAQIQSEEVQKLINNKKENFDLLLIELCVRPAIVFSHIFKAPVIHISSFGAIYDAYAIIGAPTHLTLYPPFMRMKLNNRTKWDNILDIIGYYLSSRILEGYDQRDNEMLRRNFGEDTPDLRELSKQIQMLFLNIHPIWEGNYPVPPTVVYIWGIHKKPERELPEDLKSHLDSAKNGVIYMSFGTNTDPAMLPTEKKQVFFKVLSESPYEVLWKWSNDDVPGQAKNIKYSKWFPQTDILRHPNVKLFITQGGMQSTDETITAGVPVIGIPMLGDQWYNVEKYVQLGIGVRLDLETLTEEKLKEAIDKVIGDKRYRQNILELRSLMYDQPMPPLNRAVFWAEHVIKHKGATHLRSPAANITWRTYIEPDAAFIIVGTLCLVLAIFMTTAAYVIKTLLNILRHLKLRKKLKTV